mgnify:CR=1 FL=1
MAASTVAHLLKIRKQFRDLTEENADLRAKRRLLTKASEQSITEITPRPSYWVADNGVTVQLADIVSIISIRNKTCINLVGKKEPVLVSQRFPHVWAILKGPNLIQISRGKGLNISKIQSITGLKVSMSNGETFSVEGAYSANFERVIQQEL